MFCKNCFRSVLYAINRYNHSPQTLQSFRSSSLLFWSNIHNSSNKSFIIATDVSPKIGTHYDKLEKRFRRFESSEEFDVLSEELIKCSSIETLFELISSHHSEMNRKHIAEAFTTLFDLMPFEPFDRRQVLMSAEFQLLCTSALNLSPHFGTYELIKHIKPLIFWGVSPQSMVMQSLLQMALKLSNRFSIEQILFFNRLLTVMTRKQKHRLSIDDKNAIDNNESQKIIPLVDALILALSVVFQVKIDSKKEFNYDDIDLVVKCLRMACERNSNDDIINKLVATLLLKLNELTISQCFEIVSSYTCLPQKPTDCVNDSVNNIDKLIHNCLDRATAIPTNQLPPYLSNQVVSLVNRIRGKRLFYHKGLYDFVPNYLIENPQKVSLIQACRSLNALIHFTHIHYGLMDYIREQIYINREFVNDSKISFVNVLQYFALSANYHRNKPNSAAIYDTIIECPNVNYCRENEKHLLFKLLRNLCILRYYPRDFIEDCINNYLEDALTKSTSLGSRRELLSYFVTLYQSLSLDNIDDSNESNKSMTDKLKPYIDEYISMLFNENKKNSSTNTLNRFLSQGLGGQQFVANGVFSEFGHYIDHVIVMRKGGYPVAIGNNDNEKICFIKDLPHPSDCKIIGIIGLTRSNYCRHPYMLRGKIEHSIDSLKKSGIIAVTINLDSFDALIERERIPFLMREIQETLQQSSRSPTNVLN